MVTVGAMDEFFDGSEIDNDQALAALDAVVKEMAVSAQQFALQTADARSRDKLVRVWVNAQGVVVQVEIDERLFAETTNTEAAASMLEAAQAAAAIMAERTKAFQAEEAKKLAPDPKFIDESTEPLDEMFSELQPKVPLSPPNAPERRDAIAPITSPVTADDHAAGEWQLRISDR
ncbi:YbaB/EbfC family nucleoid-associated protein [Mycobacterium sp. D16Q16]|uniref:YbaB/EbfC family nucleoid-associated protein n=1 Tax=Mycobacterium sp. D16Q16 TaxID=1855659 RepID=UPI0009933D0E|nr:YbaB/EbfC family nucleoid-associated protein [Mycobacterium sp. D16Q16]